MTKLLAWPTRTALFSIAYERKQPTSSIKDKTKNAVVFATSNALIEFILYPFYRFRTLVYTSFNRRVSLFKQYATINTTERITRQYTAAGFWTFASFLQSFVFTILQQIVKRAELTNDINAATFSAVITGTMFYPALTLTRRVQADSLSKTERYRYTSVRNAYNTIMTNEGIRGFYRGVSLYALITAMNAHLCGVLFTVLSREARIME